MLAEMSFKPIMTAEAQSVDGAVWSEHRNVAMVLEISEISIGILSFLSSSEFLVHINAIQGYPI